MGGNLFKLGRIPAETYRDIEQEVAQYLDQKIGKANFRIPRYYADKADFGDLDVLIAVDRLSSNQQLSWQDFRQELIHDLGITQFKVGGGLLSTVYRQFQVDFFARPDATFESTYHYMSFNDLGNLIGKIFKRFNLKYGEDGLSYVFRRKDSSYRKDLLVSNDFIRIFEFLQLDTEQWKQGFASKNEMFDWVVKSPYFSVTPYLKKDKRLQERARQRPTIEAFFKYLEEHQITQTYAYLEDREAYLSMIADHFNRPDLLTQIAHEKEMETQATVIRKKYNGKLIMDLFPALQGKALGQFMQQFQESLDDFQRKLYEWDALEIQRKLHAFHVKWKAKNQAE